ncbi:MAG: hypothetical protein EPN22_07280 [Nitrospirae bacterium]|nr:MAG: hypothetical protein EPN22_07280 [Nitrospirota bacterium]
MQSLLQRYHIDPSRVIELYNDKAIRKNILAGFRDLAKRVKPDDSVFVFYAGHGHIDSMTKEGSWVPVESGIDDPSAWLSNHDIKNYLKVDVIKAKHVLLVSDSCFSGDFFRGSRGTLPEVTDALIKKAYTRSSRQAITSGGLEPVTDAGFGGNSVFSHFLVSALKNNAKAYLIPTEIFSEVRSGVAKNAEQLPQFGDLKGVGGQDGGELVLFLRDESRLNELASGSAAKQKELDRLKKAEQQAALAKQKEQAEIARKEQEMAVLDKQIAEMKARLGTSAARKGDSLDAMVALVEQKEAQDRRLEELRRQREAEDRKRQQEIERLKKEAADKRISQIKADMEKYQKVASSKYGAEMKDAAWDAMIANYPEAKGGKTGDTEGFGAAFGLAQDKGEIITIEEKKQRRLARGERFSLEGGVIEDFKLGLQWAPAPDRSMNHYEAEKYAQNLSLAGGGAIADKIGTEELV